ncbi:hypothetical protein Y1Q_0006336 [Alligator mississippiensis]|uniref:Uncharacterized protein n=1 Tax=Alligator mississippiensis TaxID=8496 RepID=A0A151NXN9_ALLMI|nr:hypothetical protein Y1Q_0006336 [Alligator mississippiensis]
MFKTKHVNRPTEALGTGGRREPLLAFPCGRLSPPALPEHLPPAYALTHTRARAQRHHCSAEMKSLALPMLKMNTRFALLFG